MEFIRCLSAQSVSSAVYFQIRLTKIYKPKFLDSTNYYKIVILEQNLKRVLEFSKAGDYFKIKNTD